MSEKSNNKFCAEPTGVVNGIGGPSIRWHISSFDGSNQPYAFYLPADYDPSRSWPLVISLHGYSSDHVLNLRRVLGRGNAPDEPDCRAKVCFPKLPDVEFIIASPYGFGSIGYETAAEQDVLDVLEDVRAGFNIDPDRVFLTGLSMGGAGTWSIAVRHPDVFAGIAPVCPPFDFRRFSVGREPSPGFEQQVFDAFNPYVHLRNLLKVPVKVFHGEDDSTVPVEHSRKMVERGREVGLHVEYTEYPGVEHNAWDPAYQGGAIFTWFSQFKRIEKPRWVEFTTPSLRWPKSYWIRIDQIERRPEIARVRAEITEDNDIIVRTENVSAFTVLLDESPAADDRGISVSWNGTEVFRGMAESRELSFGESGLGLIKRKGLEGPIPDAFRDRYMLVYGTREDGSGVREAAREAAEEMAKGDEWADIRIPVKRDTEVTEEDIAGFNLILFGSPETNSLIDRINGDLPVRFIEGGLLSGRRSIESGDGGMILAYPNPLCRERLVVIFGGRSPETVRMAAHNYRFAPDYVIFDSEADFGDLSTIREWGWFTSGWELG